MMASARCGHSPISLVLLETGPRGVRSDRILRAVCYFRTGRLYGFRRYRSSQTPVQRLSAYGCFQANGTYAYVDATAFVSASGVHIHFTCRTARDTKQFVFRTLSPAPRASSNRLGTGHLMSRDHNVILRFRRRRVDGIHDRGSDLFSAIRLWVGYTILRVGFLGGLGDFARLHFL